MEKFYSIKIENNTTSTTQRQQYKCRLVVRAALRDDELAVKHPTVAAPLEREPAPALELTQAARVKGKSNALGFISAQFGARVEAVDVPRG